MRPPPFGLPPQSRLQSWELDEIWYECSPGPYFWGHRGDFSISTPELRYGAKPSLGVKQTYLNISAQGQKFKNRLGAPKSMVRENIHTKVQIIPMFGVGCRGGWSEWGASSSNLGNPVLHMVHSGLLFQVYKNSISILNVK